MFTTWADMRYMTPDGKSRPNHKLIQLIVNIENVFERSTWPAQKHDHW